jgi:site-specific DNA recombinase
VPEEELERQFEEILGELQFPEALLDLMREALRQSQKQKAEFHRRNVSQWREELAQIRARIKRHEKAEQNYIDQGIRLLEIARNAQEFYRTHGQAERAALSGFILPGSMLDQGRVVPVFKPPFDIIRRIAQETEKAASFAPTACPTRLPLLDELRTYCYEHQIEEIPALLVG